jgi:hypothetical protein
MSTGETVSLIRHDSDKPGVERVDACVNRAPQLERDYGTIEHFRTGWWRRVREPISLVKL